MRVSARACIYINIDIWHFNASCSLVELHKKQTVSSEHLCRPLVNGSNHNCTLFYFILIYVTSF